MRPTNRRANGVSGRRQTHVWLLATAVLMSILSLLTHLLWGVNDEVGGADSWSVKIYTAELFLVCVCTLVLLVHGISEHRETRNRASEVLRDGAVQHMRIASTEQAAALDAQGTVGISSASGQDLERTSLLFDLMCELQEEVYLYDTETLALIYANKAACARCNWSQEDLGNLTIADSSQSFELEIFREHTRPLLAGVQETVSINVKHEKGPVGITTRVMTAPDGKKVFASVLRDTSEQHRIEKTRLESLSEACHELRSPLTSIKGSLKLLETGAVGQLPETAVKLVSVSRRNTDRLIDMINNVLDYEKLRSGTTDVEKHPIDLNDALKEAAEMMASYSEQHNVDIELSLPAQPSLVRANTDRLVQVVINLISNAVKHSPENGLVIVKLTSDEGKFRVSVEDDGPGVPDEAKSLIFESFGQADALDGIKRHGTGLGLAISQRILKTHNTKIEFATKPGQGSQFHFSLPKLSPPPLE